MFLNDIPIHAEHPTSPEFFSTWNALPLLHEVSHALARLLHENEATVLDLRSLPLSPADDEQLRQHLGVGEITVQLDSLGKSEIWETQFPAVWWIEHFNDHNELMGRYLEINWTPAIVQAPHEDVQDGLMRLQEKLLLHNN
jgi:hydrogenase-1 operon protein HyaF